MRHWSSLTTLARIRDVFSGTGVPGAAVAMVRDGSVFLLTHGVHGETSAVPVSDTTLFQAASLSKPVTALCALRLVEDGMLRLDEDLRPLLRGHGITADHPVTVRRLLSHTAGCTVPGFPGYPRGTALPSLSQILRGEKPANTPAVRIAASHEGSFLYSGGGYVVLQHALEDVSGMPFHILARRQVLDPLGMRSSTFVQSLPTRLWHRAALGHREDGRVVPGGWHAYPEQAAAGLWTTPGDLARIVLMLVDWSSRNAFFRRQDTIDLLWTTRVPAESEHASLGFFVRMRDHLSLQHDGWNAGFRSRFLAVPDARAGIVVMTNSDAGLPFIDAVISIARREGLFRPMS